MIRRLLLILIPLIVIFMKLEFTPTFAVANVPISCSTNQYSVDRITGKDVFTNLGCYNEDKFQDAYDFMLARAAESPNVVIRNAKSDSPLDIVAADRAMAYSQNQTYFSGATTMNISRDKALSVPFTYINQANPMYYFGTQIQTKAANENVEPKDLSIEVEVNGAHGFVPLIGVDIIPLIYVENRTNNWYISFTTRSIDGVYSGNIIKPNITRYVVSDVTSSTKTGSITLKQIKVYVDYALSASSYDYGIAPSWLANGTYYSSNGIEFYTDMDLKSPVLNNGVKGQYYNYYNYLNLRTKTNYTGAEINDYFNYFASLNTTYLGKPISISKMKDSGNAFVNAQNTYGMNALMIYSMAAHESAFGTSNLAVNYNNFFGYGAYDSNPNNATNYSYPTVEDAVNQHMGLNLRYYLDYSHYNSNNSLFYASNIGNKGAGLNTRYASDPWWSLKIGGYAFRIDRYLGFKDYNYYQIGILGSNVDRSVYSDSSLATSMYSINERATNYPFVVLSTIDNNSYKIQNTNPIANGVNITSSTTGLVPYDWNASVSYINMNQANYVNVANNKPTTISSNDALLTYVTDWKWDQTRLYIKGWSALQYTNMANTTVTHQLNIVNLDDATQVITVPLNIATPNYALNIGNSYDYTTAWFDGGADMATLPIGNYRFEIVTKSNDISGTAILSNSTISAPRAEVKVDNGYYYRFSFNNTRSMRYELLKEKGVNYSDLTPLLPTRFNSTAYLTDIQFSTNGDNKEILNLTGISFMQGVSTGANDSVSHKLVLVDSVGNLYNFDLTSSTGIYDLSNNGVDYSNAWFYGTNLDISNVPDGNYNLYVLTSSASYKDLVEVRDILIKNTQNFSSSLYNYTLATNTNVRRKYVLTKLIK